MWWDNNISNGKVQKQEHEWLVKILDAREKEKKETATLVITGQGSRVTKNIIDMDNKI